MTNKKSTKKALLSSVLSLVICLTMLIGTTFAWFTDSVTSTNNIIKSGKLDVELNYKRDFDASWSQVTDNEEAIFNYDKWEPGYVDVKYIQVANAGNLAFKYLLNIIPKTIAAEGKANLADVIDVYMVENPTKAIVRDDLASMDKVGTLASLMADPDGVARGILLPKGDSANTTLAPEDQVLVATEQVTLGIALKMQESAGNEYQDLTVGGGFDIQLFATQYTWENDSFDNQYDANAPKMFTVNDVKYDTAEKALEAAKDGDSVYLSSATEPITVDKKIALTIANTNIVAADGVNAITVTADATITLEGYNSVVGGKNADGINVAENVTLTLTGKGRLITSGNAEKEYFRKEGSDKLIYGEQISNTTDATFENKGGSGIDVAGDLVIDGLASLTAKGYGIGGFGIGGTTDSISIKNSTINYVRGGFAGTEMFIPDWAGHFYGKKEPTGGAAIGSSTDGAIITIEESTITKAEGGSKGAGIGAYFWTGVTVNITDSNVTAIGGNASAGIGGSRIASDATAADAITVNIKNSVINATGGDYAAGIGSGYNTHAENMAKAPTTTVSIDAASTIIAKGGMLGAGIGTGHNVHNFIGDIQCDTTNVKAGYNVDDCCHGALCSDTEDVGLGAYKVEALYTKISEGFYKDASNNYYIYNVEGLNSWNEWCKVYDNMRTTFWGKTYNLMADIDASGVTWKTIETNMDSGNSNGITFDGNGYTISNLIIEGNGLFTGATQGTESGTTLSVVKNVTFDNVTVTGGTHHNGIVWGQVVGSITLNDVHVMNSKVSGGCNVGALIGRNSESHATIKFIDCSVKNTTVEATKTADYAGASAFLGMALHLGNSTSANVIFEGNNVAEGNTLNTATGMQGGGIYTKAEWGAATWETPVVVNDFTNYNSANK